MNSGLAQQKLTQVSTIYLETQGINDGRSGVGKRGQISLFPSFSFRSSGSGRPPNPPSGGATSARGNVELNHTSGRLRGLAAWSVVSVALVRDLGGAAGAAAGAVCVAAGAVAAARLGVLGDEAAAMAEPRFRHSAGRVAACGRGRRTSRLGDDMSLAVVHRPRLFEPLRFQVRDPIFLPKLVLKGGVIVGRCSSGAGPSSGEVFRLWRGSHPKLQAPFAQAFSGSFQLGRGSDPTPRRPSSAQN